MKDAEHHAQSAVFSWATMMKGRDPRFALLYAVPNGGQRHALVAAKLKREGVKSGVPDIHLPIAAHGYHSLYVELKVGKNTASPKQQWWLSMLADHGHAAVLCRGADQAIATLSHYLNHKNPTQAKSCLTITGTTTPTP